MSERKQEPFIQIQTAPFNNNELSLSAKGMLAYIKGKPDNWIFYRASMAKDLKEGNTAISSALNELKELNYIDVKQAKNKLTNRFSGLDIHILLPKIRKPLTDFPPTENIYDINIDRELDVTKEKVDNLVDRFGKIMSDPDRLTGNIDNDLS